MFLTKSGGKLVHASHCYCKLFSKPYPIYHAEFFLKQPIQFLFCRGRNFSSAVPGINTDLVKARRKNANEKELHELDLSNAKERKQFVRRINCEEDASSVEMLNAFNKYRELYIHDVRLSFKDLITLIHNMINKYDWDHIVYVQMLDILYEYHSSATAYDIILKMREAGIQITSTDYLNAIRVCTVDKNAYKTAISLWNMMLSDGTVPTRVDYELLMNCCIRSEAIVEAEQLFEVIRNKGLKPTVWTYNILMTGYKRTHSWERALQMYQIMKLDGIEADGVTYTILLDLLFSTNKKEYCTTIVTDIQKGCNYIQQMSDQLNEKYPSHVMDSIHLYNCDEFLAQFDSIVKDDSIADLHTGYTQLFLRKNYINALLRWFIDQDNRFAVLYLYKATQRSKKSQPNDLTYKLLFHYCGIKQDTKLFESIMNNMVAQGISYNSPLSFELCPSTSYMSSSMRKGWNSFVIRLIACCYQIIEHSLSDYYSGSILKQQPSSRFIVYPFECVHFNCPSLNFLYQFVKDYGERKLEGVRFHDVSIMGHSGLDELKGSRNVKIILSVMNNIYPHINTTQTDDNRIILHLHSFMNYVREEGRRYQAYAKKGKKFELQININKVINECFSEVTCEDS